VEAPPATNVLSGPPSRGNAEFQWTPDAPHYADEPTPPASRRVEPNSQLVIRRSDNGDRAPRILEYVPEGRNP
jgi:hypothetical protein